jgi:hypothetical protein
MRDLAHDLATGRPAPPSPDTDAARLAQAQHGVQVLAMQARVAVEKLERAAGYGEMRESAAFFRRLATKLDTACDVWQGKPRDREVRRHG